VLEDLHHQRLNSKNPCLICDTSNEIQLRSYIKLPQQEHKRAENLVIFFFYISVARTLMSGAIYIVSWL
jgi:hypothetical protein